MGELVTYVTGCDATFYNGVDVHCDKDMLVFIETTRISVLDCLTLLRLLLLLSVFVLHDSLSVCLSVSLSVILLF